MIISTLLTSRRPSARAHDPTDAADLAAEASRVDSGHGSEPQPDDVEAVSRELTDTAVGEADHPCAEQTDGDLSPGRRKPAFTRVLAFVVLPLAAVLLAALCGYLK